jgi:hypothetical protein
MRATGTRAAVLIPPTCGSRRAKLALRVARSAGWGSVRIDEQPPPVTSFAPLTMCPRSPQVGGMKKVYLSGMNTIGLLERHCERSETIHARRIWIASSRALLAMTAARLRAVRSPDERSDIRGICSLSFPACRALLMRATSTSSGCLAMTACTLTHTPARATRGNSRACRRRFCP